MHARAQGGLVDARVSLPGWMLVVDSPGRGALVVGLHFGVCRADRIRLRGPSWAGRRGGDHITQKSICFWQIFSYSALVGSESALMQASPHTGAAQRSVAIVAVVGTAQSDK
jgi:hypothetical protein